MSAVIKNEKGTITISNSIIDQVLRDAVAATGGRVRFAKNIPRDIDYGENGLLIKMSVEVRFGTRMRDTVSKIISDSLKTFRDLFELEVDNMIVRVVGVFSRKVSKRDISFDMFGNITNAMEGADEKGTD